MPDQHIDLVGIRLDLSLTDRRLNSRWFKSPNDSRQLVTLARTSSSSNYSASECTELVDWQMIGTTMA